jgi:hypothetical protein
MNFKKVFQSVLCGAFILAGVSHAAVDTTRPAPVLDIEGQLRLRLSLDANFEFDRSNFIALKSIRLRPADVNQLLIKLNMPPLKSEQALSNGQLAIFTLSRIEIGLDDQKLVFERMTLEADFEAKTTPLEFVRLCDQLALARGGSTELIAVYQVTKAGASLPLQSRRSKPLSVSVLEDDQSTLLNFPKALSVDSDELTKIESKMRDLRLDDSRFRRLELALSDFCAAEIDRSPLELDLCNALGDSRIWQSARLRLSFLDTHEVLRSVSWAQRSVLSDCEVSFSTGRPECKFWAQNKSVSQMRVEQGFTAFDSIVAGQKGVLNLGNFFHFLGRASDEDALIEVSVPRFDRLGFR